MTLFMYTVSVIKKGKFNMANYLQLGQGLMKHLPTAEGCTSTVKLSKKGIEALAKKNPELGKVIEEMTKGAENPTLEIAQKAQGNYAIAGFKIRNGETILGKGAYSTSTGANGVVEKMHVESGDIITTVTKEGNKVVSKNVSKSELAKAAQEKAKASEFMTEEIEGLNGERILSRKFKNGNVVETETLPDGTIKTTIKMPDGKQFTRFKKYTTSDLPSNPHLKEAFPEQHYRKFKRVQKDIYYDNGGLKYFSEPPQGTIYGERLGARSIVSEPILKYKGYKADLSNTNEPVEFVISTIGKAPEEVQYMEIAGFWLKEPQIVGQKNLASNSPLKNLHNSDVKQILS